MQNNKAILTINKLTDRKNGWGMILKPCKKQMKAIY